MLSLSGLLLRSGRRPLYQTPALTRRNSTTSPPKPSTDSCGIPTLPVWSVNKLLSSYPSPTLSDGTIGRLYELSALIPPKTGTAEYAEVKKDLEEMVRLVEAVRLVDTDGITVSGRREKEDADIRQSAPDIKEEANGQELLNYSTRTRDGFYIVDSERRR